MNKGIYRIIIGILCVVIAAYMIFSTKEEIEIYQLILGAYGLFSVGIGLYFFQRDRNAKP